VRRKGEGRQCTKRESERERMSQEDKGMERNGKVGSESNKT
jgi:hypothetical protein